MTYYIISDVIIIIINIILLSAYNIPTYVNHHVLAVRPKLRVCVLHYNTATAFAQSGALPTVETRECALVCRGSSSAYFIYYYCNDICGTKHK